MVIKYLITVVLFAAAGDIGKRVFKKRWAIQRDAYIEHIESADKVSVKQYGKKLVEKIGRENSIIQHAKITVGQIKALFAESLFTSHDKKSWMVEFVFSKDLMPPEIIEHELGHGIYFTKKIISGKNPFLLNNDNPLSQQLKATFGVEYFHERAAWKNTEHFDSDTAREALKLYRLRWFACFADMVGSVSLFLALLVFMGRLLG